MGDISTYYKYLFPAELYVKWLNYDSLPDQRARHFKSKKSNNLSYLARREFSMTLEGDIYIRYQTIDSNQGPKTQIFNSEADYLRCILLKKKPIKIDIGAIYNDTPVYKSSRHVQHELKGASVIPKEKEICFDIDMTDYSAFKNCGPAPKFGHFWRCSEQFSTKKSKFSKLPGETSPKDEPARQF